jgi:methyl-accepting chemotaxis protein
MAIILFFAQFNTGYSSSRNQLLSNTRNISDSIFINISESFELLRNLSVNPVTERVLRRMNSVPQGLDNDDFLPLEEAPALRDLMFQVAEGTNAELVYMATLNSTGILLGRDVQIGEGFDVRGRDYYIGALANPGKPFISQPRVSAEQTAEPKIVITAARSVESADGSSAGIVALNYSFTPIIAIIRELMESYNVRISLFDTVGGYMLWEELEDSTYFWDPENLVTITTKVDDLLKGQDNKSDIVTGLVNTEQFFFEGDGLDGASLIQSLHIPNTRWGILVTYPVSLVYREVLSSILPPIILFIIVFLTLQIIVYFLYSRIIVRPILRGVDFARSIASGDLTARMNVVSNDEVGRLSEALSDMVDKLQEVVGSVLEVSKNVAQGSKELSSNTVTLSDGASQQAAATEEVSASMEQMTANISQNADNANETEKIALQAATDAEESGLAVKRAVEAMSSIIEKVSIIEEIAKQTNLLALNAAIEAARAGDHGKGFAVVASEVRKLAERSQRAASEISELSRDSGSGANQASQMLENLVIGIKKTADLVREISSASAEQKIGVEQVNNAMTQLDSVVQQNASFSEEIASSTEELAAQAQMLNETTSFFKIDSEQLQIEYTNNQEDD